MLGKSGVQNKNDGKDSALTKTRDVDEDEFILDQIY
jgi:hypothetical protein